MGCCCRINWYIRCSVTVPLPDSSTSTPWAAPGGCPSIRTRNFTDVPGVEVRAVPLYMTDDAATAAMVDAAVELAEVRT